MTSEFGQVRKAGVHQGSRIVVEAALDYLFHTVAAIIVILAIVGFRYAVSIENQCIADFHLTAFNLVLDACKHAEWKTGGFDAPDGGFAPDERRTVAGVGDFEHSGGAHAGAHQGGKRAPRISLAQDAIGSLH